MLVSSNPVSFGHDTLIQRFTFPCLFSATFSQWFAKYLNLLVPGRIDYTEFSAMILKEINLDEKSQEENNTAMVVSYS